MKHVATRLAHVAAVIAVAAIVALAQGLDIPPYTGFVNDFANVVDPQSRERMETMARNFRDRTQIDVAVVTLQNLQGRSIEEAGLQIGRDWKVGAGQDANGVVVVLAVDDRQSRIEVSRHLEGDLTDVASAQILRKARPSFAAGQYGQGLQVALESLLATLAEARGVSIDGIDQRQAYREQPRRAPSSGGSWTSRLVFLVVLVIFIAAFSRGGGGGWGGGGRRRRGISPWILPGVFWGGGGWGGRGGGFGGGGGWGGGGGGGGGGFGGFGGGGDFGGGGSSDSW